MYAPTCTVHRRNTQKIMFKGAVITLSVLHGNSITRSGIHIGHICMYDKLLWCFQQIVSKQQLYTRYKYGPHYRDKRYLLSFLAWWRVLTNDEDVDKSLAFILRQRFNLKLLNALIHNKHSMIHYMYNILENSNFIFVEGLNKKLIQMTKFSLIWGRYG